MEASNLPLWRPRISLLARVSRFALALAADSAALVALGIAAEALGRAVRSDWPGALLWAALFACGAMFLLRSRVNPAGILVRAIARRLRAVASRPFRLAAGFDFREFPPTAPFRLPQLAQAALACSLAAACLFAGVLPGAIQGLQAVSGTLFLAALGSLWCALVATALACAAGLLALAHLAASAGSMRKNPVDRRNRRKSARGIAIAAATLLAPSVLAGLQGGRPAFIALLGLALLHAVLSLMPRTGDLPRLLLTNRDTRDLRGCSLPGFDHALLACSSLWAATLMAAAGGASVAPSFLALDFGPAGSPDFSFAATRFSARVCAFLALATLAPLTWKSFRLDWMWLARNPATRRRRTLSARHGSVAFDLPDSWRLKETRMPPPRTASDLDYDPDRTGAADGAAPPLRRDLAGLSLEERLFILEHFDFVTKRRSFYRGMEKLLKIAAGYGFASGAGFLLAPHLVFVDGMHRDDPAGPDSEWRIVGPPFARLWDLRTRQFLYESFRAMDVDIVYFEDAIRWPQLCAVLDQAFEASRMKGAPRPIGETDFSFLPGVRVFFEQIEPDTARPDRQGYQEPHLDNLSRARVMMVFKDHGGQKDDASVGSPDERVPIGMGV